MKNVIADKSLAFAIRTVKLCRDLIEVKREYILSKQLMRSGTSIGSNVREAEHAQSKKDFLNKMNIALKEANETGYWILLLKESGYMDDSEYHSMIMDADELLKILASIVKTTKQSLNEI